MRLCLVLIVLILLNRCHGYYNVSTWRPSYMSSTIEYKTRTTKNITIPVMVHFDRALTYKLAEEYKIKSRRKLKEISRSILKDVEAYYRHPSLNQHIHISLIDTKFMRSSKLPMDDNGSVYLRNYCTRQAEKKKSSGRIWYSILVTGRDVFYLNARGEEVRSSTGRGYRNGICAIAKSCAVVEWNPKNIGYLIAHEMGHSLGMLHDGPPYNDCKPHVNIMSSKYHPRYHPKSWSRCSKKQLERFMETKKAACLR